VKLLTTSALGLHHIFVVASTVAVIIGIVGVLRWKQSLG
jgi:hypothetical protein